MPPDFFRRRPRPGARARSRPASGLIEPRPSEARPAGRVPSPCTGACVLSASRDGCAGCGRTMAEISTWTSLEDAGREAILDRLRAAGWPVPQGDGPRPGFGAHRA